MSGETGDRATTDLLLLGGSGGGPAHGGLEAGPVDGEVAGRVHLALQHVQLGRADLAPLQQ